MKPKQPHSSNTSHPTKSLLLFSVNFRLVAAAAMILAIWTVLSQLL